MPVYDGTVETVGNYNQQQEYLIYLQIAVVSQGLI